MEKHELPVAYCGRHRRNTSNTEYDRFFMLIRRVKNPNLVTIMTKTVSLVLMMD
jgi:hypothetical protein